MQSHLLIGAALFAALSLYKPHRREWLILCVATCATAFNAELLDHNDPQLYVNRALLALVAGIFLCLSRSILGFYQAIILLLVLIAYGALAYDVSQGRPVLIYNNYERVMYGLAVAQLVGAFPTILAVYRNYFTSGSFSMANLLRYTRS